MSDSVQTDARWGGTGARREEVVAGEPVIAAREGAAEVSEGVGTRSTASSGRTEAEATARGWLPGRCISDGESLGQGLEDLPDDGWLGEEGEDPHLRAAGAQQGIGRGERERQLLSPEPASA